MAQITILYGSQSGCSQEIAERIERQGRLRQFTTKILCMDEFTLEQLTSTNSLVIFVASTTGQGVAPDNMKSFWTRLLHKSLPSDALSSLKFSVFGLGDSSYPVYNAVARRLYQRLLDLGAQPFHPRGLGDDQHALGIDDAFEPWVSAMWSSALTQFRLSGLVLPDNIDCLPTMLPPTVRVTIVDNVGSSLVPVPLGAFGSGVNKYVPASSRLSLNKRLTPVDHFQDVRLLEFEIPGAVSMQYSPGDILIVHPSNPVEPVRDFISDILKRDPYSVCVLNRINSSSIDSGLPFGSSITLLDLFSRWLDVFGTPRRYFFEVLSHFAVDELEKEKLQEFSTPEGQQDLAAYAYREKRTYAEVLEDFPSVKIPLEKLIEVIPRLKPRQFSIASSPLKHLNKLQIIVAVVEFLTPYKRRRIGLCSQYLRSLNPDTNASVPIWVRSGSFALPPNTQPLIMIGPGTGIAPFRSMCHQISMLSYTAREVWVFFGCRNRTKDFFFAEEWRALLDSGDVSKLETAFSRDQIDKIYVQDRLRSCGAEIWRLFNEKAILLLAGSSNAMPRQVHETLVDICEEHGNLSRLESEKFIRLLQKTGRYLIETW